MRTFVVVTSLVAVLAARGAFADDSVEDLDGDGDVDDDDRAALEAAEVIEVKDKSDAAKLAESSRAVTVVDLHRARERNADLGEVLSRTHGIQVRRNGGLGSSSRFSLNGLYDKQVRFFLDGIPLDYAGFGLGVANVPIELIQRVDVYRGVVPIAFGADALGGAVDLVTDPSWVDRAVVSYQVGSFGTHRLSLGGRVRDDATGLALGVSLYADRSRNDYLIDVKPANDVGTPYPARVRRFHDGYLAAGAIVEGGLVEKGPIERAIVRVYETTYDKDLQHNIVMTLPYGEATYAGDTRGVTSDVALALGAWRGRLLLGGARSTTDFRDVSRRAYNWYGQVIVDDRSSAEVSGSPVDQRLIDRAVFARALVERRLGVHQQLRVAVAPTLSHRTGIDFLDHNPAGRDPASARRKALQVVGGIEHELTANDDRFENTAFAKVYYLATDAEDPQAGYTFTRLESSLHRFGIGDSARLRLGGELLVKASYEWATRLPSAEEMFGDGVLVTQNLALRPELSHNANLGMQIEHETPNGTWTGEASAFARLANRMIVLLGNERNLMYQNVFTARIVGLEGMAGWTAQSGWATVTTNLTLQDLRNVSSKGTFGTFEGDRLPNRPWLLGSIEAMARRRDLIRTNDELAVFATSRYVHSFFRGWESQGLPSFKQVVDSQLVHGIGVTYAARGVTSIAITVELQNLTDGRVFDSWGVQRPGRSLSLKLTGEL